MSLRPDKAAFVSAVLLILSFLPLYAAFGAAKIHKVQSYRNKYIFLPLQKLHLVAKMNLHFHSDQRVKTIKCAGNMLMFNVDVNIGMRFKKNVSFL